MVRAAGQAGATATAVGEAPSRPAGLVDTVYSAIFARLTLLRIAPGDRLTIDALARELGVSPTPVREALSRMESEGLIHKTHLVGYRAAAQLTARQFEDLYDLRLLLEPHLAAKAAEAVTPAQLAALRELLAEMAGQGEAVDYGRFAQLDKRFHDEVARAAGNEIAAEALARLHTHVHLFRLMSNAAVADEALKEHAAVIDALERRDPADAAGAMRAHIENARARLMAAL